MMYAIVEFVEEGTVEAVPRSWVHVSTSLGVDDQKCCYWPPSYTKQSRLTKMVRDCQEPDASWDVHHIRVLAYAGIVVAALFK